MQLFGCANNLDFFKVEVIISYFKTHQILVFRKNNKYGKISCEFAKRVGLQKNDTLLAWWVI